MYREHGDEIETSPPTWGELLRRAWRAYLTWRWNRTHLLGHCCFCGELCSERSEVRNVDDKGHPTAWNCAPCVELQKPQRDPYFYDTAIAQRLAIGQQLLAAQQAYQQQNTQYTEPQYYTMLQNAARQQQHTAAQQNTLGQLGGLGVQLGPLGAGGFEALRRALGHRWPGDPT